MLYIKSPSVFQVSRISSLSGEGVADLWSLMCDYQDKMAASGEMDSKRARQRKVWMWSQIRDNVLQLFRDNPAVREKLGTYEESVAKGQVTPGYAADRLLAEFKNTLVKAENQTETIDRLTEQQLDREKVFK